MMQEGGQRRRHLVDVLGCINGQRAVGCSLPLSEGSEGGIGAQLASLYFFLLSLSLLRFVCLRGTVASIIALDMGSAESVSLVFFFCSFFVFFVERRSVGGISWHSGPAWFFFSFLLFSSLSWLFIYLPVSS